MMDQLGILTAWPRHKHQVTGIKQAYFPVSSNLARVPPLRWLKLV